ncbi:hypothetical protein MASR2M78_35660 [Treponema sp.]
MDRMENTGSAIRAFNALFSEIVESLLAKADKPYEASAFIAEELRALVGARTVLVFLYQPLAAIQSQKPRLVSVFPQRRQDIADKNDMETLIRAADGTNKCKIVLESDDSTEGRALKKIGSESAVIVPLAYATQRVGSLLLLDLLDTSTTAQITEPLEQLSSILALVLRNGELFSNLELEVENRTQELRARSKELELSLHEKEVLLKEVHHRVKNNLQIVISLLYMKAESSTEEKVKKILDESQARIYSLALIHEEMYRTDNFAAINLGEYISRITERILEMSETRVEKDFRFSPLYLDLDTAIPCGLIISELIMNAVKHVFTKKDSSKLRIIIENIDREAFIEIADDGNGLPADYLINDRGSIGMSIINGLAAQLNAKLSISNEGGACFRLRFPLPN